MDKSQTHEILKKDKPRVTESRAVVASNYLGNGINYTGT
jgi:hypothetical protein